MPLEATLLLPRLQLQSGRVVHRGSPERPKKTSDELKREAAQKQVELQIAEKKALENLRAERKCSAQFSEIYALACTIAGLLSEAKQKWHRSSQHFCL